VLAHFGRRPVLCVALSLSFVLFTAPAIAGKAGTVNSRKSGKELLQEAKILYDNLQYRQALNMLKTAIRKRGNRRSDIVTMYKYMAFSYIALGKKKHARRAFELMLKVNPNYELNPLLTSPKILNFFNKVRNEQRRKDRVIMKHTPVTESIASARIEVKAYVVDLHKKLRHMRLYFKRRGDANYSVTDMHPSLKGVKSKGAKTYVGVIPFIWTVYEETELFVDYYIAALDSKGNWVANAGSPKEPISFRINLLAGELPEGARKTPLVKSWWFWTLVGVGVAGIGVGGYFLVDSLTSPPGLPETGEAVLVFH